MTRRLLLAVVGFGCAIAAVVLFSGTAHAATGLTLPSPPPIPPVRVLPVPTAVPPAPGLPPLPVPPIVVVPPPVPVVPRVVVRIVPLVIDTQPSDTPRPSPSAVPRTSRSTTGSPAGAWAHAGMQDAATVPTAHAHSGARMISSGTTAGAARFAFAIDQSVQGAAGAPRVPAGQQFALRPTSAFAFGKWSARLRPSRAPPPRAGFHAGGGRPG
jgi:hypothetical protein